MKFGTPVVGTGFFALVVAAASMGLGQHYTWPDYHHTDYGFPLIWGTHVENSILGPVDRWVVNYTSLAVDIVFWAGVVLMAMVAVSFVVGRMSSALVQPTNTP